MKSTTFVLRRAFTLIELLVVIAIIAILAAILFPVFAQAKAAAKMAVSLSNIKQESLAQFIYSNDYDDQFIIEMAWNTGNDPIWFGSAGTLCSPWGWTILPYMKTAAIFEDPLASSQVYPGTIWEIVSPQYGYDYNVLSPYPNWGGPPVTSSSSQLAKPADTVMMSSKANPMLCGPGPWNVWVYVGWGPSSFGGIEEPDCNAIPIWCISNWGITGITSWDDNGNLVEGAQSGLVAGRGPNYLTAVTWADGHATKTPLTKLAAGTNWTFNMTTNLVITDATQYVWELNNCTTAAFNGGTCY